MKIIEIDFKNFRKAKELCTLKISNQTIIVGKNNTNKTSISEMIVKFLTTSSNFSIGDFNNELIKKSIINSIYVKYCEKKQEYNKYFPSIEMNVKIKIGEEDNLADIKNLLFEFENNELIIIKCLFSINDSLKLFTDFEKYNQNFGNESEKLDLYDFFIKNMSTYYSKKFFSAKPDSDILNLIDKNDVYNLFNIFSINAQRTVDDISDNEKMTISNAIWKFYQAKKQENKGGLQDEDLFRSSISEIKNKLDSTYSYYFNELLESLNNDIINDDEDKKINIISEFEVENLLKNNSKIKYLYNDMNYPESSNGLGYSNLLYIVIQLESFKFKMKSNKNKFNIIFIEEPESHLHPQMQSVFLKKIKRIIDDENIYTLISTHSSYILQSSDINNICYFVDNCGLKIKSLSEFMNKAEYNNLNVVINKYFVTNTCDLFFADKVIFVEGMAERIMLPFFYKIIDNKYSKKLSSQHISLFEVGGRHAYIFQDLANFLEIKHLTITDIDSVCGTHNSSCPCDLTIENLKTTNPNLRSWFNYKKEDACLIKDISVKYLKQEKRLKKIDNTESLITFQLPNGSNKWGRTFEEQLIIENSEWLVNNLNKIPDFKDKVLSLKKDFNGNEITITEPVTQDILSKYCYEIVKKIEKSSFALELIEFDGWCIPNYILEGLLWIEK